MRWRALIAIFLLLAAPVSSTWAEVSEYAVKAAFVLNFVRFVEWPDSAFESPDDPIVIGVLGPEPFGSALESTLEGKSVGGRKLRLVHFDALERRTRCHLLVVSRDWTGDPEAVAGRFGGAPVLTVSDRDDFLDEGGMIRLLVVDDTVRFEVNRSAAESAGLRLSSRLLAVAHLVREQR